MRVVGVALLLQIIHDFHRAFVPVHDGHVDVH